MSCKTLQESISDTTVESQCEEPLQVFRIAAHTVMSRIGRMNPSVWTVNTAVPSSVAVEVLSQSYRRPQVNPTVESNPAESSAAVKQESHVTEVTEEQFVLS